MGKSSLFVRSFSTWVLLVVFLLSCTTQPPVVKQATSPLPSASPFWLESSQKIQNQTPRSLDKGFSTKSTLAQARCFPSSGQSSQYISSTLAAVVENIDNSGTVFPGPNPIFIPSNGTGSIQWSILSNNLIINKILFSAYSGPWGYHIELGGIQVNNMAELKAGTSLNFPISTNLSAYYYGQSSGNTYPLSGQLSLGFDANGQIRITINAAGALDVQNSGLAITHNYVSGSVSITGTATLGSTLQDCENITLTPSAFTLGTLTESLNTDLKITPTNTTRPWSFSLTPQALPAGCNAQDYSYAETNKTGVQTLTWPSAARNAAQFPNGTYTAQAFYSNAPERVASEELTIQNRFDLIASANDLLLGRDTLYFDVFAPGCPNWTLMIDDESCILATGSGNQAHISWDGRCNGNNSIVGAHSALLKMGAESKTSSVQISTLILPTPTATPTPDPNASGSPDPNATPTPGPTTTPCPGNCPTPTPVPTATPCPGGICPTPTPGPTNTPTPRPTATPTKKPGNESKELDLTLVVEPEISNPEEAFSILQTKVSTGHFKIGYGTYVDLGGEIYLKKENKAKAAVAEALATIRATGTVRLVDSSGNQIPGFRIPFEFLSTRGTAKLESTKWFGRNGAGAGPNFVPAGKYSLIGIVDNVDIRYNEPNPTTLITLKVLNINKEVMVINDFPLYSSNHSIPKVFTPDSIQHILERHKRDYLSKAQHAFFVKTLTEMKDIIVREGMATNPNVRGKKIPSMVDFKVSAADNQIYGLADKVNPYRKDDSFPDQFSANYVLEMARSVANMSDVADQWGIGKDLTHKETGAPIESIKLEGKRGATTLSAFAYYGQPQNEDQIIRTAFPTNLPLGSPYSRKGMKNLHYYTKICDPLFDPNDPIALFTRYSSFSPAEHTAWETSCFTNLHQFVPAGMR